MIRILFLFLILLLSVLIGIQLKQDPGYVLIAINHWTVETSLVVGLIILLLAFIAFHAILLMVKKLRHYPEDFKNWQTKRRTQKAQATTRQGLIEFSEGYWSAAKSHLIKALPNTDTPLLNYLTAARAAQELGESKERDDYLREAQQSMPEAKIAVELTQAQLQLANQQWEQALATLRHLQDLVPHHPYVLKLLMELYLEIKDWPQLLALLPELKKNQTISGETYEKLRRQAYLHTLLDSQKTSPEAVTEMINSLPRALRDDPELMAQYAKILIKDGKKLDAESILRRCLKKHYSDELVYLYGLISVNKQQLSFAESLLKKQPSSATLLLSLGRLSLANQLWGKAKTYLEKSVALKPKAETYTELGELYTRLGNQAEACQSFRKGLILMNAGDAFSD